MRRCRAEIQRAPPLLAAVLAAVLVSGCTLSPGAPWGEAEVSLDAAFAPPDTNAGRLHTSTGYALELSRLAIEGESVRLTVGALDDDGPLPFDPEEPPPGYSICHNGHCDADDGRLVPYDEVARELESAGGGGAPPLVIAVLEGAVELDEEPAPLALAPCDDGCFLERGALTGLSLTVHRLEAEGRAFDLRFLPGEARLPPEGAAFSLVLERDVVVGAALDEPLDGSAPPVVVIAAHLEVAPSLFDEVAFDALSDGAALEEALAEGIAQSGLVVDITREELSPTEVDP